MCLSWIVLNKFGIFWSLAIATITLLIPGRRARRTEPVAIVDAITIKKENSEKRLISKATLSGVIVDCNLKTGLANKIQSFIFGGGFNKD